jgi:hypothetical protein
MAAWSSAGTVCPDAAVPNKRVKEKTESNAPRVVEATTRLRRLPGIIKEKILNMPP